MLSQIQGLHLWYSQDTNQASRDRSPALAGPSCLAICLGRQWCQQEEETFFNGSLGSSFCYS